MGNSYDNDDQNQQQANGGLLVLLGMMFWSMVGGQEAEPAAPPRPKAGAEIKPSPTPASAPRTLMPPTPVALAPASGPAGLVPRFTPFHMGLASTAARFGHTMPDVPAEVEPLLSDPDEWVAFLELSQHPRVMADLGPGARPAGFMPALNANEPAGGRDAMRADNEALRREAGLEASPGLPAGAGAHVHNAGGRVRRSGSASPVGDDVAAVSLPRAAVRADLEGPIEQLAVRCVEL